MPRDQWPTFFIFLSVVNEKSLHWHILRNFAYATYVHTKAYLVGLGDTHPFI